jgi:polyphosphate kinase
VEDEALQAEVTSILEISLSDNVKRRDMCPDGSYNRPSRRGHAAIQSRLEYHRRTAESYAAAAKKNLPLHM